MNGKNSGAIRTGGGGGGYCGGTHGSSSSKTSSGGSNYVGGLKNAVNLPGTTQKSKGKPSPPPKRDDPNYFPDVGYGFANDCTLSGGRKKGGPALVVLRYSTRKPILLDNAVGVKIESKEGIVSFGSKRSAGFYHTQEDPGVVHFFGKDLVYQGKSLLKKDRRRLSDDSNRVQELEAQVEALQATVRRLEQTVSSLVKAED